MAVAFFTSVGTIVVIYSMTSKIQTFASDVMRKTEALQEEKQLTDRLLYQMMPKWVSISFLTLKFNWYQIYVYIQNLQKLVPQKMYTRKIGAIHI